MVVHRARDATYNRFVALHRVRPLALPPEHTAAFLQELRAAAQVRHPYLLPILAVGLLEGQPSFTTPLTTNRRLSPATFPLSDIREAAALIEKLAGATAAAHAHGLLHGALKPSAVRFDESNQPLLGEFGLEPLFVSMQQDLPGSPIGNPGYFAPEQLTGRMALDASTDLWALGVILYELLTGRHPFIQGDLERGVAGIQSGQPVPPRQLRRDIDPVLEAVVLCGLEKQPGDRYPSARALADDLERWRLGQPTVVRPPTWTERVLRALRRKSR